MTGIDEARVRAVTRRVGDQLEAERLARIAARPVPPGSHPCGHYIDGEGYCKAPTQHRYLPGWRCPVHTPARFAGRPETVPDPKLTLIGMRGETNTFVTANETVVDARAKASGKRRSTPQAYRAAQAATT